MKKLIISIIVFFLCFTTSSEIRRSNQAASSIMKIHESSIPPLPKGVVAVEYLESTGTQYIDTGVKLNSNHVVSLLGMQNYATSFFGSVEANKIFNLTGSTGVSRFYYYGGSSGVYDIPTTFGTIHTYVCGRDFIVDGELKHTFNVPDFSSSVNALLFARQNKSTVSDKLYGRIYWLKIEESDVLIRDFIPVRFTNEQGMNEGAMYDLVSKQLFYNAGSGKFLIGPDKR